LALGLPALRLPIRTSIPCSAFPRLLTASLFRLARLAGLLATLSLHAIAIGLCPVGLFAVATLPLPVLALPVLALPVLALAGAVGMTGLTTLARRAALLPVVARLRLFATLLTALSGTALLPGLGFALLSTVLLRCFLLRGVLLTASGPLGLRAAPLIRTLFTGGLGRVTSGLFTRGIFALRVLVLLPVSTLRHAFAICFVIG
jgi:hypothetical protein